MIVVVDEVVTGRGGILSMRTVYSPGGTPRNVNAPAPSVTVVAVSRLLSRRLSSRLDGVSVSVVNAAWDSAEDSRPDTLNAGTGLMRKSTAVRSSPESIAITVADEMAAAFA